MKLATPRIGVDFHVFDGKFQGSRSHLVGLYGELTRLCPDFQFFFLLEKTDELGSLPGFSEPNVERVFMRRAYPLTRLGYQLPKLRQSLALDLIHTQYIIPFLPSSGNAVTIHDVLFESHPQFFGGLFALRSHLLIRWSASAADLIFTVSEYSRSQISFHYGIRPSQIHLTPNASDSTVFFPGNEGLDLVTARGLEPQRYLLTVGRIEPRKNHVALLRAYCRLEGNPPPLVIVGQLDFGYSEFKYELTKVPPGHKVLVLPDVGDDELPALYRHAALFVYPSFAEGFGMPPLEAMASGVPVIASDTTAIREVVAESGLLVDPFDSAALRRAMERVMGDQVLRRRLISSGLDRARSFTWRNAAEAVATAYKTYFGRTAAK